MHIELSEHPPFKGAIVTGSNFFRDLAFFIAVEKIRKMGLGVIF